ncbi:FKBP-type peptidyl-prolyl cis-trans isomerase [Mucilaginibacter lappiensis]|uniref:Peptidyl-prolyl cis-trans isomerase n=1 Tax=Mucilaginibacter lappiensis TaxID=354630 RepID=A0A1N7A7A9_9SPHI|nr:FKBP-type peptidyl-prolyl cis-trans isomerase [Mucilaginibacter lappiensis]MBB6110466.1 FKBP-type peptidyl-prolyl cis-trans isomerase [Mucilaginibacter lappiensis]MBB6128428.1 FKBP-type peptidyl-prolyl cis-trans isomerase [Mucilaginibacter lappiensis]SIR35030.1 FKBP-type peptidyl-prolyl cis-trans isomerase FkpA [Mucilaginibacter lappiensis]
MKKYFLLLSLLTIILSSCLKTNSDPQEVVNPVVAVDPVKQAAADSTAIVAYLAANPTIKAKKDTSGLYYQILNAGTGTTSPTINSTVTVSYTGSLLNGSVFGSSTGFTGILSNLIPAWQIGLPFIKQGGSILLIVPSRLGYGNTSPGPDIPANSVLVFTIGLTGFN